MYCNKCGNEIAADAKFCPKCGAQYHTKGSVAKKGKMGNKKRITIIAISCVCLIALISVLGYQGKKYYDRYRAFRSGRTVSIGEGRYEYNSADGEAIFRGGCMNNGMVEIPSQIRLGLHTYRVTKIGDEVFYNCESLTSITLPDSVTEIGDEAFEQCDSLTSITLPGSVSKIGVEAFSGCDSLTNITLPEGVTEIGEYAFSGCDSLTSITLPEGVTEIGEYAFYDCESLTSITLPDSVTKIGAGAFYYCDSLTSISLPNSEVEIGEEAIPWHCMISYRNQSSRNPSSSDDYDGSDSGYKREDFVSDKAYREYLLWGDTSGLK